MATSKKLTLILIGVLCGSVLALVLSNLRNPQKKVEYKLNMSYGVDDPQFARVLGVLLGPPVMAGHKITGLYNGQQIFPAMLEAIASAQKTITFESYIYWSGEVGEKFVKALAERARAGVKVHVLVDWLGSGKLEPSYYEQLEQAGVEIEKYHPLRWYDITRMNNRTHRKLLVIDGKVGFTGGVGIADVWAGNADSPDHWRDSHYRMEGPAVAEMQAAFMDNWLKSRSDVHHDETYFPKLVPVGNAAAQVFDSAAEDGRAGIQLMYMMAIAAARKNILLSSAYFLPDDATIREMVAARKRGVNIEIIAPGAESDVPVVRSASRAQWGPLLEAGVHIYEYQPTMFHCKVMIIDEYMVSVGSTNFDDRSFRLNEEANLNILDRDFASAEARVFADDKGRSKEISLEDWKHRPMTEKLSELMTTVFRSQL
jgi:cardiolipin synthase